MFVECDQMFIGKIKKLKQHELDDKKDSNIVYLRKTIEKKYI